MPRRLPARRPGPLGPAARQPGARGGTQAWGDRHGGGAARGGGGGQAQWRTGAAVEVCARGLRTRQGILLHLFYSILLYSILFYSILFYSILFYSILFYSILFYVCASSYLVYIPMMIVKSVS